MIQENNQWFINVPAPHNQDWDVKIIRILFSFSLFCGTIYWKFTQNVISNFGLERIKKKQKWKIFLYLNYGFVWTLGFEASLEAEIWAVVGCWIRNIFLICFSLATVMERRSAVSAFCCTICDLNDEGENGLLLSASPPITDLSFTPTLLPV